MSLVACLTKPCSIVLTCGEIISSFNIDSDTTVNFHP